MTTGSYADTLPLSTGLQNLPSAAEVGSRAGGWAWLRPLLLVFSLLILTPGVWGATLTNTLTETGVGFVPINNTDWSASSFTTTASDFTITDVTLKIKRDNDSVTGDFKIDIYTSILNTPDSLKGQVYTGPASGLATSSYGEFSVNGLNIVLEPSTQYFIVLRGESLNGDIHWPYAQIVGSDLYYADSTDSGGNWVNDLESPYLMRVDAAAGPSACGDGIPYTPGDWHMLALPCMPSNPGTVASTFGDGTQTNLTTDDYGVPNPDLETGWAILERTVGLTPAYVKLDDTASIETRTGYWFKSYQPTYGGTLEMTGTTTTPSESVSEGCASVNGCVVVNVSTPSASTNRYNLVGNPFPYDIDWSQVRVRINGNSTTYTPCQAAKVSEASCPGSSSNPNPAVISNVISIWDPASGYVTYDDITTGMEGKLLYFTSFWVNVLPGAYGKTVQLLIPALPATTQASGFISDRIASTHLPWYLSWLDWLVPPAAADGRFVPGQAPQEGVEPRASLKRGTATQPTPIDPAIEMMTLDGISRQGLSPQAAQRAAHTKAMDEGREWFLRLKVNEPGTRYKDHNTVIGQLLTAQDGYDSHDLAEMDPYASPYLTLVIPHQEWGANAGNYASDFRNAAGDKRWKLKPATWTVELRAKPGNRKMVLNWEADARILQASRLRDLQTGKIIKPTDRHYRDGYAFTMKGETRRLAWEFLGLRR